MRVIGLDYGSVTCGVAISDETLLIASPVETIRYKTMEELLTKLDIYFNEYKIDKKTEEVLPDIPDGKDHWIDSTRYALSLKIRDMTYVRKQLYKQA